MPAYKDSKQGTWYASFYFENWQGVKQKKLKRGFATKKDALAWEREFLLQQAADLTITFEAFVEIYITDKKKRLRENTWSVKEHIIQTKILPYFKEKRLSEIKPRDVIAWQNEMLNYRDKNGKAYSPTYLKTLHGQLSAILKLLERYHGRKRVSHFCMAICGQSLFTRGVDVAEDKDVDRFKVVGNLKFSLQDVRLEIAYPYAS